MRETNIIPGKIIFKAIVGSQAYGTNTETSDVDIKGVYVQDINDILGYKKYQEQVTVHKDECYYELSRFLELLQKGNPTMIELLFSPEDCVLEKTREWDFIRKFANKFLTQSCKDSFIGYAQAQIKKASGTDKKMNWEKEQMVRKEPLDFCWIVIDSELAERLGGSGTMPLKEFLERAELDQKHLIANKLNHGRETYQLYVSDKMTKGLQSDNGNTIRVDSSPKGDAPVATFIYNEDAYSKHCKKYKEYQEWMKNRNTQRFVDVENHDQKIDGKNMLHCLRLLRMGQEILRGDGVIVRRADAQELLSIRRGEKDLQTIQDMCKTTIEEMKTEVSNLPEEVNDDFINYLIMTVRKFQY